jgi:hypothetical protein
LNLPVVEEGDVLGIVDVLKLTYVTLEQINSIQGSDGEGPMWGRFWDSFGATDAHESESQLSDPSQNQQHTRAISPEPSALQGFSEILPNESASMVANDSVSEISAATKREDVFSFKFTTAGGKTHRFASAFTSYTALLEIVRQKVIGEHLSHLGANTDNMPVESWLSISYLDDENDQVLITSDADVADAVKLARKMNQDRVKLFVVDATEKEEQTVVEQVPVIQVTKPQEETPKEIQEEEPVKPNNDVAGIPQELILPAAIAFLGVVIIGVFAFSRVSTTHR